MFADLSWSHVVIFGGILALLFGARRFPEIGRSVGQGIRNLYRGVKGALDDDSPSPPPPRRSNNGLP